MWAIGPISIIGLLYYINLKRREELRSNIDLSLQFKECLLNISNSLNAGYSIENAFIDSRKDMSVLFGDKSDICRLLDYIRRGLVINIPLEELLISASEGKNCREIKEFASVFAVQKRNGGNLTDLVRMNAELIEKRLELRQEIEAKLSGVVFEMTIMRFVPFGMMLYINATYEGYFDVLYGNFRGILVMTICLSFYVLAYGLGEVILRNIAKDII